jgi:biotin operon repressor
METRAEILKFLKERKKATSSELCSHLGISRQALNKYMKELIREGKVGKIGVTRGAIYRIPRRPLPVEKHVWVYPVENLEEDIAFEQIALRTQLKRKVTANVHDIIKYAFTEMMNNVVEHSRSPRCRVTLIIAPYRCGFAIRDFGVGVFSNIQEKLGLSDEGTALRELLKGKTTTMREKHTGEGVFFTSKLGDDVILRSHKLTLEFNNIKDDVFLSEGRFLKGTEVRFGISRRSRRRIDRVFLEYAPEDFDYRFERTKVLVKLYQEEFISRSEARRLLSGLDKFKEVILDFKGVLKIGQGFADEVFRVFKSRHPEISIRVKNMSPALKPIIQHVVDN